MTHDDLVLPGTGDETGGGYFHFPPPLVGRRRFPRLAPSNPRELRYGVDPTVLASCGWGVVFAQDADPAVREALAPLLAQRRWQAAACDERRFRELAGPDGYRKGESKLAFLTRHTTAPGPVEPHRMPYYLLLVGSPQEIPFEVQQSLDLRYAVGRLAFDTPEEYHRYAQSVVAFESRAAQPDLRISLFGADNPGDRATHLMSTYLMPRLAAALAERPRGSNLETILGTDATKARLAGRLTGPEGPAHLLFAAAHGLGFAAGSPLQRANQGALVCSDDCFAADDLPADARLDGLIAFFFACHGAGTPSSEPGACGEEPRLVAPEPFVARLPQRLLASGALAVMGHVGRAWGYSYIWDGAGVHTAVFEDTLQGLLAGQPIGHASQPFNARYAELAADLNAIARTAVADSCDPIVARLSTATEDARNYVILGDPAVRLPTA